MSGYESGFTGAINDQSVRDYRAQQIQQMQQQTPIVALQLKRLQDQAAARAAVGALLKNMQTQSGQLPPPPMVGPPPPGANEGPLPPGVGTPSVPMAPPAAATPIAPAAPMGEPPIPPYQALPQPPADTGPDQTGGDTEIAAPPGDATAGAGASPAAAAPAAPAAPQGRTYSLPNIINAMKAQGVPDAQVMDMLDELRPTMSAENQQELNNLKIHNAALAKAQDYYVKTINALINQQKANTQATDVASKVSHRAKLEDQGDQKIAIAREKIYRSVGGGDAVKRSAPVYDTDGNQIGWNVLTKGGQTRNFDLDGNPRAAAAPGTPGPKTDQNRLRQINSLNSRLNTLNNLIKKTPADQDEMENIKGQLRSMGAKVAGGAAPAPAAQETKVLNGKTYVKKGGQWYAQ